MCIDFVIVALHPPPSQREIVNNAGIAPTAETEEEAERAELKI